MGRGSRVKTRSAPRVRPRQPDDHVALALTRAAKGVAHRVGHVWVRCSAATRSNMAIVVPAVRVVAGSLFARLVAVMVEAVAVRAAGLGRAISRAVGSRAKIKIARPS
jgi:hypothetical protein